MPKLAENSWLSALREAVKQPAFLGMMAAPIVAGGYNSFEAHRQKKQDTANKAQAFREMIQLHPHLRQRDPSEVARVYSSIHNVSPTMARDPLVAGAWVDNVLDNKTPGMNSHQALLNAVKDLSGVEKNVSENRRNAFRPSGTGEALGSTVKGVSSFMDTTIHNNIDKHFAKVENAQKDVNKEIKDFGEKSDAARKEIGALFQQNQQRAEELTAREQQLHQYLQSVNAQMRAAQAHAQGGGAGDKQASTRSSLGALLHALRV
jgi:hypothetical protein